MIRIYSERSLELILQRRSRQETKQEKFSVRFRAKRSPFQRAPHIQNNEGVGGHKSRSPGIIETIGNSDLIIGSKTTQVMLARSDVSNKVHLPSVNINLWSQTFNMNPNLIPQSNLTRVHPWIKQLFSSENIPNVNLAGRLKYFVKAWETLTQDPNVLSLVKGYEIPLLSKPRQQKPPQDVQMNLAQRLLVDKEVDNMLKKGAILKVSHSEGEFLSNLFLVEKKDGGHRPVINLKNLNSFIPYQHFKMEGLHYLKYQSQEGDYMCKLDLKDAYFCVPLSQTSRRFVRFHWSGNLYEFLCLCFGLGPAPRIFTKLLKIPMAILRRINIRIIIYIDDMLIMSQTIEEMLMIRDTVIFLLQHLGLIINLDKSVLIPVQDIEFLGLRINSVQMTLSLPKEKHGAWRCTINHKHRF